VLPQPPSRPDGLRTEPGGVERDHNRPDAYRYDPLKPPAGYTSRFDGESEVSEQPGLVTPPPASPGVFTPPPAKSPAMPPLRTTPPRVSSPRTPSPELAAPGLSPTTPAPTSETPLSPPSAGVGNPPQHWVGASKAPTSDNSSDLSTDPEPSTNAELGSATPPDDHGTLLGLDTPAELDTQPELFDTTTKETQPEPDVMLLPEPDARNRPTVSLERSPVPGQARLHQTEPLPRPTGDPATDARLEKLENSPFWLDNPETRRLPEVSSHVGKRRRTRKGAIRKPAPALLALITLALVATFFAWVSAEPFWLAVGHGDRGYATTSACNGSGVVQRCAGRFDAADGSFVVTRVALLGVGGNQRAHGAVTPARMVSADSRMAYLGSTGLLVQLRWILGFVLVLMCGFGIAGLTGARRLDDPRARRLVILASLLAPVVLLAGFLGAAY
jgi:hypothetical protein